MRSALRGREAPLVVDLSSRDVPVTQKVLHLTNIHSSFEKQGGGGGSKRVRRVNTLLDFSAARQLHFLHRPGQAFQIVLNKPVHGDRVHGARRELLAPGIEEERESLLGGRLLEVKIGEG